MVTLLINIFFCDKLWKIINQFATYIFIQRIYLVLWITIMLMMARKAQKIIRKYHSINIWKKIGLKYESDQFFNAISWMLVISNLKQIYTNLCVCLTLLWLYFFPLS